jgi:hypothetical protein
MPKQGTATDARARSHDRRQVAPSRTVWPLATGWSVRIKSQTRCFLKWCPSMRPRVDRARRRSSGRKVKLTERAMRSRFFLTVLFCVGHRHQYMLREGLRYTTCLFRVSPHRPASIANYRLYPCASPAETENSSRSIEQKDDGFDKMLYMSANRTPRAIGYASS